MKQTVRPAWWRIAGMAGVALLLGGLAARAGYTFELDDGLKATLGADMRIRLEGFDRSAVSPEMEVYGRTIDNGPAYKYLRVRTRLIGTLEYEDWMRVNAKLTNRSQHFFSRPGENNDGAATWEVPDEVIVETLNLQLLQVADSSFSLTIGRQDLPLGNGMVFLEGTPYDQGRTVYFDGVSVKYEGECYTVTAFAFYNDYKDKTVFWDDQNRALRRGDIFTTGAYWTHHFREWLNTDLYYIYANVNDTRETEFEPNDRNFPWYPFPCVDQDARMHIIGARVFGSPHEQVDYSIEYAEQYGEYDREQDLTGDMLDVRLTLKAPKDTPFKPSVLLQYTAWSGDDPDSRDEFEGWDAIFSAYPIFVEELIPIMINGNWSNINQYRVQGRVEMNPCWSVAAAYAYLAADYGDAACASGGGTGDSIGHLLSLIVGYDPHVKLLDAIGVKFALQLSEFYPSSYWNDGDNSTWGRFETTFTF